MYSINASYSCLINIFIKHKIICYKLYHFYRYPTMPAPKKGQACVVSFIIYFDAGFPILSKRILRLIKHSFRLIKAQLIRLYAQILEHLKQRFSVMTEGHGAVMGIIPLNKYMAVEASHLRNGKDSDSAEGTCRNGKHLALCHVSPELAVGCTLDFSKNLYNLNYQDHR